MNTMMNFTWLAVTTRGSVGVVSQNAGEGRDGMYAA